MEKFIGHLSDKLFTRNRAAALKRDRTVLRIVLIASIICFLLLFAAGFRVAEYAKLRGVYAVVTALYALLFGLSYWTKEEAVFALAYALHTLFIGFCSYTSAFVWPGDVCVMVLTELFIFPTLFLDKGWRVTGVTLLSAAFYLTVISFFKDAAAFGDELVNVACFTLLGCIVGAFAREAQLKGFDSVEKLRLSQERYQLAMRHSGSVVCEYDVAKRCIVMTPEVAAVFGTPECVFDVPEAPVRAGSISPETSESYIDFYKSILDGRASGTAEFRARTTEGWRWLRASYSTVFSADARPVSAVVSFVDVSEQHAREETLKARAETDGLTGLYNRAAAETLIARSLAECTNKPCTLLLVDLDDLKTINDQLGHPQGDRALRLLSEALRSCFRQTDLVGRVGGDEFVVFLYDIASRREAEDALGRLMEQLSALRVGEDDSCPISASIGAAFGSADGRSFDRLYHEADQALYRAKRNGKKQYVFYRETSETDGE